MDILIFKHIYNEPAGHAEQWADERGHSYVYHYWDEDHVLTGLLQFDLLIIMGGMMGAYDESEFPWLVAEKRLIREAVESGRKVVGICLGAQMIASALGARVYKNIHAEIGFHRVIPVQPGTGGISLFPEPIDAFQWHGDTFDLPDGACLVATSENIKNQAFTFGNNTLALQFHPEMNHDIIGGLLRNSWEKEASSPWKQSREAILSRIDLADQGRSMLFRLLDELTARK